MSITDFARSFRTQDWRLSTAQNSVRIQLDAKCTIIDDKSGESETFYLVAPCRGERYNKDATLFAMPSYEWGGIFSGRESLVFRTHWVSDRDNTTYGDDRTDYLDVRTFESSRQLSSHDEIVRATRDSRVPFVARTELRDEANARRAILEYPVKTMNAYIGENEFQVDTGPLIVPDFSSKSTRTIEQFDIAHVVYNTFDKAEFILRKPVQLSDGDNPIILTTDYCEVRVMAAHNEIFCAILD